MKVLTKLLPNPKILKLPIERIFKNALIGFLKPNFLHLNYSQIFTRLKENQRNAYIKKMIFFLNSEK